MAKYIGFRIPTLEWDGYGWLEELIETRGSYKAYTIKAKNADEARKKLFEELIESEFYYDYVLDYLKGAIESYDEDEMIDEYGEDDGKIINEILDDFYNMTSEELKNVRSEKRIYKLSAETMKELAYMGSILDFGIMEVAKEI